MKITATAGPYILTFLASKNRYRLSAEDVQRLLDEYPAVSATKTTVILQGHNTSNPSERTRITPVMPVCGGIAFTITDD